ncbi:hypothetical protein DL766_000301 [Monosporascus sp. MC13-8B]|uniref:Uncharacterized protein n=1 Tax=Monosporascus cannonballus TaxID=155416 RepID=A0ABY0H2K9_9PEZI|nr:hypothetical protein DL762_006569 [Monosporascus cannonballus]RYO86904.1 hypothetical protein DL763_006537 [Monosporascus cannonballus]RYP39639.1 hypothetical protein DL766_000301 [Monosporascus sp. MC13-8B]
MLRSARDVDQDDLRAPPPASADLVGVGVEAARRLLDPDTIYAWAPSLPPMGPRRHPGPPPSWANAQPCVTYLACHGLLIVATLMIVVVSTTSEKVPRQT